MSSADLNPRTQILSIDPGVNGAYAIIGFDGKVVETDELPRFAKLVNGVAFAAKLQSLRPERVVIEKVGAMPGQGVSSTFTFGAAYGVCIGVACGYGAPISYITPARWKAHFRLLGKDKDAHPALGLKKHVGRADAILLARFSLDIDKGASFT
jgi:crossover junction endodeoxyribonuclease RuvC